MIKENLKFLLPKGTVSFLRKVLEKKQLMDWKKNGCPVPPPHIVKQITIKEYQQKYGCTTLIETGTYLGHMVRAQKGLFKKVISIELGYDLFNRVKKRFKNDNNVSIVLGNSGEVLPKIMKDINDPALFWIDAHYSFGMTAKGKKECPIFQELAAIVNDKINHIILIDDARSFIGKGEYPTIAELRNYVKGKNEKYEITVKNDIIRCVI